MQTLNIIGDATLRGHNPGMTREEPRDAAGSGIGKHLTHNAVISLGRGSTEDPVVIPAREGLVDMAKGGAASPATGKPGDQAGKLRDAHGKEPRGFLPRSAASALVKVDAGNTSTARQGHKFGQLPSGRGSRLPVRLLRVLHDSGEPIHSRSSEEEDNRPEQSIAQGNLIALLGVKIREAPEEGGGADRPGSAGLDPRPTVPTSNTPSLTRGPAQDHDDFTLASHV